MFNEGRCYIYNKAFYEAFYNLNESLKSHRHAVNDG